jgi:U32 family peptidase
MSSNLPADESKNARAHIAPELLAPAGDWDCARAAVENGADAIYFGLDRFNARMRADNFTLLELPALMEFLHSRGVRGYLAFNTLVFQSELAGAAEFLRAAIRDGVDAAIVQDVGLCRRIREISPNFPIHASTQMTVTSSAGMEMAKDLGASLVVVARECSIADIEKIRETCGEGCLPIETFVHGALCVAYSGQCLTSEALGGRSANRGECAQACRLPYDLIADGKLVDLGAKKYLLSPRDLASVELVPALLRAGVVSLKIEGRLKSPEYVASITRIYREAIDVTLHASTPKEADAKAAEIRKAHAYDMEMAFSRGLHTGWLIGTDNKALVHANYPKKRGVFLGKVAEINGAHVRLEGCEAPIAAGDGVVFDLGHPELESGGFVTAAERRGRDTWISFHFPSVRWTLVKVGALAWKTADPALDKRIRETFADEKPHYARPVDFSVAGKVGCPLKIVARDSLGNEASAISSMPLDKALERPLDAGKIEAQLSRLGGTPFCIGKLSCEVEGGAILPVSELNRMRRAIVEKLLEERKAPKKWTLNEAIEMRDAPRVIHPWAAAPILVPMVRDLHQLEAVLPVAESDVYAEFEDHKAYRGAMEIVRAYRAAHGGKGPNLFAAPPRIYKDGESWILDIIESANPDGYLARNAEHLRRFKGKRVRGDYTLNAANARAVEFFVREKGLEGVTASCDLDIVQLSALLEATSPEWLEITLHQHMPMFHMEHCVFCAFLSEGRDYRDCGRPCEKHRVYLRDRTGAQHYLRADAGCRNTLFNARAQTGADYAQHLINLGARRFRIEFLEETPDEMLTIIDRYKRLLSGEIDGAAIWREFKLENRIGVTRGTLKSGI